MTDENLNIHTTKPTDFEQEVHDFLKEKFTTLDPECDMALDPDGDFSFVVVAFSKPANPAEYCGEDSTRAQRKSAVGSAVVQICPDVQVDDEGFTEPASVMGAGIHALCSLLTGRFLTQAALPQIVSEARVAMYQREEKLNG